MKTKALKSDARKRIRNLFNWTRLAKVVQCAYEFTSRYNE